MGQATGREWYTSGGGLTDNQLGRTAKLEWVMGWVYQDEKVHDGPSFKWL